MTGIGLIGMQLVVRLCVAAPLADSVEAEQFAADASDGIYVESFPVTCQSGVDLSPLFESRVARKQ